MTRPAAAALALASLAGCGDPVEDLDLNGQTVEAVVERYGAPDDDARLVFRKGERPYEFQSGAYAAVMDGVAEGDTLAVRQLVWDGWVWDRAVWAAERDGAWRVVDAIRWPVWVRF